MKEKVVLPCRALACLARRKVLARLDPLRHHGAYRIVVTEHVRREVSYPDQAAELAEAIAAGDIDEIQVTDPVELEIFAKLSAVLGSGESACIAVAANRGWVVAMDELGRARKEVHERVGRNVSSTHPVLSSVACATAPSPSPGPTASR